MRHFSIRDLKKSIGRVRGTDKRTIIKWVKILERHEYTKFTSNRILTFGPNGSDHLIDATPELVQPVAGEGK